MKKFITLLSITLLLGTTGCSGSGDYEIQLINGFKVIRTSAECIFIGSPDYSYDETLIPLFSTYEKGEYVTEVGHNDSYIAAKTNQDKYYILDTESASVSGPLTKEEFSTQNADTLNNIELSDLTTYKK